MTFWIPGFQQPTWPPAASLKLYAQGLNNPQKLTEECATTLIYCNNTALSSLFLFTVYFYAGWENSVLYICYYFHSTLIYVHSA